MTNTHSKYEAPAITSVGTLSEVTKGGGLPNNELPNQKVINNDSNPPITDPITS